MLPDDSALDDPRASSATHGIFSPPPLVVLRQVFEVPVVSEVPSPSHNL